LSTTHALLPDVVNHQGEDNSTFSAGDVLRGRHLRTAFTHWSPFLVVDDNGVVVGGHDLVRFMPFVYFISTVYIL
jgi:hypothetical protein